ncbi:argininosuccinate lyase [Alloiococcus sp. CFN-8]|uniref:argininosuccinate lyase n=1 Tax=Alloiococcus sp. CFN-8 TaxID=3416081 RepID=UPI003CF56582
MEKLWKGRFKKPLQEEINEFNASIAFDKRMYSEDIFGSVAHVTMLAEEEIISFQDKELIIEGLEGIKKDIESGELVISDDYEDIHSFVEGELTKRIGDAGKRLHTARSRNDQVALDLRLYLKKETDEILLLIKDFLESIVEVAEKNTSTIMPGYTHLQRAQPITFGHHLMAYGMMLLRDKERFEDAEKRLLVNPLGSCALAGTTFNINREATTKVLGFKGISENSIDGVSDRDFVLELASNAAITMMHLSRFSEEIILWCSWEYRFIELDDSCSTGSSIMPQKKNPDVAELVRGKTGRVYGDLITLFTMLKGLPLAYNKDMQEDKEAIFDSIDTLKQCLKASTLMVRTMKVLKDNMREAAAKGFINATDCADYLVNKGLPFRKAYMIVGEIVSYCLENQLILEELSLDNYRSFSELFQEDVYKAIAMENCLNKRISRGGSAPASVKKQIEYIKEKLKDD